MIDRYHTISYTELQNTESLTQHEISHELRPAMLLPPTAFAGGN